MNETVVVGKGKRFRFNVMVVGESGQGKTTFLKTLLRKYCGETVNVDPAAQNLRSKKTVEIANIGSFVVKTDVGDCEIFLYDTPGYGDFINNQNAIDLVGKYLDNGHYLWRNIDGQGMTMEERNMADSRIHCVFYFISSHRIKTIDKAFIGQLSQLVPIVPVIAKADTMTFDERRVFLCEVYREIAETTTAHHSAIYDFYEDDADFLPQNDTNSVYSDSHMPSTFYQVGQSLMSESSMTSGDVDGGETSTSNIAGPPVSVTSSTWTLESNDNVKIETEIGADINKVLSVQQCEQAEAEMMSFYRDKYDNDLRRGMMNDLGIEKTMKNDATAHNAAHTLANTIILPKVKNIFAIVCDSSATGIRHYPWGELNIDDERHSDFRRLQRLMFEEGKHIQGMLDETQNKTKSSYKRHFLNDIILRRYFDSLTRERILICLFVIIFWTFVMTILIPVMVTVLFPSFKPTFGITFQNGKWN